jgi:stage II sporulation protein D
MSQYGAHSMAKLGYKYDEILKYYYSGIEIVNNL